MNPNKGNTEYYKAKIKKWAGHKYNPDLNDNERAIAQVFINYYRDLYEEANSRTKNVEYGDLPEDRCPYCGELNDLCGEINNCRRGEHEHHHHL